MKLKLIHCLPLLVTIMILGFTSCNSHVVKTENLNVRSAPTKNGKVIGQLHYNDRVKVTPHNEAWGPCGHGTVPEQSVLSLAVVE